MSTQGGYRDDRGIGSLGLPALDGSLALLASCQENVDGHDKLKSVGSDVHLSIDDFVVGDFPEKARQIHTRLLTNRALNRITFDKDSGFFRPTVEQSKASAAPPSLASGASVQPTRSRPILSIAA